MAETRTAPTTREEVHKLVDQIPTAELHAAARFLEFVREHGDPLFKRLMDAPFDDEPETEEERAGITEAYEDLKANRIYSMDEVKKELGI